MTVVGGLRSPDGASILVLYEILNPEKKKQENDQEWKSYYCTYISLFDNQKKLKISVYIYCLNLNDKSGWK